MLSRPGGAIAVSAKSNVRQFVRESWDLVPRSERVNRPVLSDLNTAVKESIAPSVRWAIGGDRVSTIDNNRQTPSGPQEMRVGVVAKAPTRPLGHPNVNLSVHPPVDRCLIKIRRNADKGAVLWGNAVGSPCLSDACWLSVTEGGDGKLGIASNPQTKGQSNIEPHVLSIQH